MKSNELRRNNVLCDDFAQEEYGFGVTLTKYVTMAFGQRNKIEAIGGGYPPPPEGFS